MSMKIVVLSILIVIVSILGTCGYLYFSETPKSYFKDYSELEKSGLIEKGWVPSFLPKSSYDIHEQHSIDENWVKMSFKFSPNDTSSMASACSINRDKEFTIYLCQNKNSQIKITTNNGHAKYSSTYI